MGKFFGDFSDFKSMVSSFAGEVYDGDLGEYKQVSGPDVEEGEILFATYGAEYYQGATYILGKRNGKYYKVEAFHCSCNGLEGEWSEDPTTLDAVEKHDLPEMLESYNSYGGQAAYDALAAIIKAERVLNEAA